MFLHNIFGLLSHLALSPSNSNSNHWLEERLRRHNLQIAEFEDTGRGIKTLRDHEPGSLILSIPGSNAITPRTCLEEYAHIKRVAEKSSSADWEVPLTDAQIMALGILKLHDENDPRVCTLPEKQYSLSLMPDEIKTCLPPCYERLANEIQKKNKNLYENICRSLMDDDNDDGDQSHLPTLPEFLWALASTSSRSFTATNDGDNDASWRIMLPGIDLINHHPRNDANLIYNSQKRRYEFRSRASFSSGDEITFSYGDMDNLTLLANFGFCTGAAAAEGSTSGDDGNNNNLARRVVSYDLRDVLLAAQSLVPNIYPNVVVDTFVARLRDEGNYPDPDLFAYDGNEGAPRFCLRNAVRMVRTLGERLAEMPLEGLDEAIVRALLNGRRKELGESIGRIERVTVDDDWRPFVSSIRLLLYNEIQTLC